MKFTAEKMLLPEFPRTQHLPHAPNIGPGDKVATPTECAPVFTRTINVEEKIDAASVGMMLHEEHPLIRNRDHIIRKGYSKNTAAKQQFVSVWTWFYANKEKFLALQDAGPYSVYGEWCVAQHGIHYTNLPDWFVTYDVYDYEKSRFICPPIARKILLDCGFSVAPLIHQGTFDGGYEELAAFTDIPSAYTNGKMEGIYLKVYNDQEVTHRFKMVRPDFARGALWNAKKINKNTLMQKSKPTDSM